MGTGGGGGSNVRQLDQTSTWAVASVCFVIIVISIVIEKALHDIGQWFVKKRKSALFNAIEKVKDELMVLGFISLLMTFCQNYIAKICIPEKVADTMLPCTLKNQNSSRRLLWDAFSSDSRRVLSYHVISSCPEGKVPLVSTNGLHQLHIFIFFLALFHVFYSVVTMVLGRAKIRGWKEWENETSSIGYEYSNAPSRFRFAHETSFVRKHTSSWNKTPILLYTISFFLQFYASVSKADYQAMRHGFINVHLPPGKKFDFRKYIKRSLQDDFKVVVGISPVLWASAVLYLLIDVKGWNEMIWVSVMPLVIILAVGTKLQAIITTMALEIKERHVVIQGLPIVQLDDEHFWFGRPDLVLFFIHFTLFQNSFQIIHLLWIWYEFGMEPCFRTSPTNIVTRLSLGLGVQVLCSYVTLPLYALVSQMGSSMKTTIFDEQTSKALKIWHQNVKKKMNKSSPSTSSSSSPTSLLKGRNYFSSKDDFAVGPSIIADLDKTSTTTTNLNTQVDHLNIEDDEFHSIQL